MATSIDLAEFFYVAESMIHGKGLFSRKHLENGTYLGEYCGPATDVVDTYVLWAQDEQNNWIGRDGRNLLRFINHSNNPCAEFCGFELFAIREISPGMEITVDYGEDPAAG